MGEKEFISKLIKNAVNKEIKKLDKIFDNPNRMQIIDILKKDKEINITEISKKIGLSYQNTHAHIKILQEVGMVKIIKKNTERGKEGFVVMINPDKMKVIKQLKISSYGMLKVFGIDKL